ncbi:MAG: hypothetical protein PHE89_08075 [Alphaproteobacteria bacterium]|nr:hypothetical protein [Alphaproteobacteria bacterium]
MTLDILFRKLFLFVENAAVVSVFATLIAVLILPFCVHHLYHLLLKLKKPIV